MPKSTRCHNVNQQHLLWMSESNKSPQPCELFFLTYYTVRALTLQNDVTWCYEKTFQKFFKNMLNQTVDLAHNG